jgi:hypothetical protein
MTQLSQPRRTNLPRKPIPPEELRRRQQQRDDLSSLTQFSAPMILILRFTGGGSC